MKPYVDYLAFHKDQFPSAVKAGETDILVIGFPKLRNYINDRRATTPDVRSGPIKSEWESKSEGCAQLEVGTLTEEGFSGSPVILTKYMLEKI